MTGAVLLYMVFALLGIMALKFIFSFDVNKWMDRRDRRLEDRIRRTCPHTTIYMDGQDIRIDSMLTSPPGTHQWICSSCGMATHDAQLGYQLVQLYGRDPQSLLRQLKAVDKLAKKL